MDDCISIQSKNTKHCWMIQKMPQEFTVWYRIRIEHEHTLKTAHYHDHAKAKSVKCTIDIINGHDDYVLTITNHS